MACGRQVVIYLDNSYSLFAPAGDKIRALDAGLARVRTITAQYPDETRFRFLNQRLCFLLQQLQNTPVDR